MTDVSESAWDGSEFIGENERKKKPVAVASILPDPKDFKEWAEKTLQEAAAAIPVDRPKIHAPEDLDAAGRIVGKIYHGADFKTLTIPNGDFEQALNAVMLWCKRDNPGSWLFLSGIRGTGKTHLQACCLNLFEKHGRKCAWHKLNDLLTRIRNLKLGEDTRGQRNYKRTTAEAVRECVGSRLIIDEAGSETEIKGELTPDERINLNEVFDRCYVDKIPIFLATNLDADQPINRKDDDPTPLMKFLGPRIMNRYMERRQQPMIIAKWASFRTSK